MDKLIKRKLKELNVALDEMKELTKGKDLETRIAAKKKEFKESEATKNPDPMKVNTKIATRAMKKEEGPNLASPENPKGLENKRKPVTHDDCGRPFQKDEEINARIRAKISAEMGKRKFGEADATRHVIDRDRGDKIITKPKQERLLQSEKESVDDYVKRGGKINEIPKQKSPETFDAKPTKSVKSIYNTSSTGYKKDGTSVPANKGKVKSTISKSDLVKALDDAGHRESALLLKNWGEMDVKAEEFAKAKNFKPSRVTAAPGPALDYKKMNDRPERDKPANTLDYSKPEMKVEHIDKKPWEGALDRKKVREEGRIRSDSAMDTLQERGQVKGKIDE